MKSSDVTIVTSQKKSVKKLPIRQDARLRKRMLWTVRKMESAGRIPSDLLVRTRSA